MSLSKTQRVALLSNGNTVPLAQAASCYAQLRSHLEEPEPETEWDIVRYLRQVCLGRPIDPEQRHELIREQLLRPDGEVDPVMRAVVLSAVRGEGRVLHLSPPFTDPVDRAVAEFLNARDYLMVHLPPEEAQALFTDDIDGLIKKAVERSIPDRDQRLRDLLRGLGLSDRNLSPPDSPDDKSPS